ncbi:MAG TPA: [FeFe] hydrogenase H-cluster maturation GTPase HydF [bacterium]|nr:[FeFe] hydrogenase H-cluster maturation GTPase HydF [bacterium]HPN31264.1 [FeFe] hydrogenase H-cluster maturation GTPase HydF [bacterium]
METGLGETPSANRPKIIIIGRRNAGKSSFINALSNQNIAIVSDTPGTTADPVYKPMEILPIGPVTIVDTAGLDDKGKLGKLRVEKTFDAINSANFVFLVVSAETGFSNWEKKTVEYLGNKKIPFVCVINKIDLNSKKISIPDYLNDKIIFYVSSATKKGISEIKDKLGSVFPKIKEKFIVSDLIKGGDVVVLVVPIDLSAPKGRLILPQVQTIREILDSDAVAVVSKERELRYALDNLKNPPKLVITDSQAIMKVAADVPESVPLTTFSVLFARYKGDLDYLISGLSALEKLKDNDKIIIIEACSHHQQADDLGRVKIPRWLSNFTGKKLQFDFFSGKEPPKNLKNYKLGIHCGGCMLNQKEMETRMDLLKLQKIPVVNYGIIISYVHNAFPRVLKPFGF